MPMLANWKRHLQLSHSTVNIPTFSILNSENILKRFDWPSYGLIHISCLSTLRAMLLSCCVCIYFLITILHMLCQRQPSLHSLDFWTWFPHLPGSKHHSLSIHLEIVTKEKTFREKLPEELPNMKSWMTSQACSSLPRMIWIIVGPRPTHLQL